MANFKDKSALKTKNMKRKSKRLQMILYSNVSITSLTSEMNINSLLKSSKPHLIKIMTKESLTLKILLPLI